MAAKKAFEDYLEAIYVLEQSGESIQSVKVAKLLSVSRPAVNQAVHTLIADGYAEMPAYGNIVLTAKGREVAKKTYLRHTTIKNFLLSLGVSEQAAEADACKIEHIISEETLKAIQEKMGTE